MYYLDLQKLGLSGANPYFSCNRRVSERGRQCGMFQMLLYSISYFRSCTSLLNKFTKSVFYNGRGGGGSDFLRPRPCSACIVIK